MNVIQLTRLRTDGKAVWGYMDLPIGIDVLRVATLENADFLIPAGKYPLKMTYSPKFKKLMPEICEVPEREGIRIHTGTVPEHSTGCVLVTAFARQYIDYFMDKFDREKDENEILQIEIL
jgi:hypothetical protein